ncbi:MAG: DNA polymerase III subunit gamma/tau [Bacteroidia bacterium]|jgi:DNA polymerase-3 subunit gamma/tau
MENFVVSARKYRPSTFESVIGQEHITQTLRNAIRNNKLAHAFLFCGPRGVGKTTCARILAKTINCENLTPEAEACNTCNSCKTFNANASFNIYELDAASNNSVDDIRGLVEQVRYAPQGSKYKIYIIDEVHMLTAAAFNAFLKTLEEPPPYAKFILATTERHKILPTILSRCQVFDFQRISIEHAVTQLRKICESEGIQAEEEALHVIAQKADGAMRDALSIFDRMVSYSGKIITYKDVILNLNILDYDYYFQAIDLMQAQDVSGLFLLFDTILQNGFDALHFLSGYNEHIRNLLVCKYPNTLKLLEVAPSIAARFQQQAATTSASMLMNAMNLINKCELEYRASKNQRLHIELTLLKLCHIQSVLNLQSEVADLKKKTTDLTSAPSVEIKPVEKSVAPPVVPPPAISVPKPEIIPVLPQRQAPPLMPVSNGNSSVQSKLERLRQNSIVKPEIVAEPDAQESLSEEQPALPLDTAKFTEGWKAYITQLEQSGKMNLTSILKQATFVVINDTLIELTLASKHEQELFEEDRISIIPFLRGRLQQPGMEIQIKLNEQSRGKSIFTAEDRFKLMAERNPVLTDLRNALGLELEY